MFLRIVDEEDFVYELGAALSPDLWPSEHVHERWQRPFSLINEIFCHLNPDQYHESTYVGYSILLKFIRILLDFKSDRSVLLRYLQKLKTEIR